MPPPSPPSHVPRARWIGFRLDILCAFTLLAATLLALAWRDSLAQAMISLALTYVLQVRHKSCGKLEPINEHDLRAAGKAFILKPFFDHGSCVFQFAVFILLTIMVLAQPGGPRP